MGYAAAPRLVRAPAAVVALVPPLATASVPARVIVPEVVTGPPDVVRPVVPPEIATLVTVPPASVEDRVVSEICSPDPTVRNLVAPVESSQKNIRSASGSVSYAPVPPLASGRFPVTCDVRSTSAKDPPRVRLPELVTVPDRVSP